MVQTYHLEEVEVALNRVEVAELTSRRPCLVVVDQVEVQEVAELSCHIDIGMADW